MFGNNIEEFKKVSHLLNGIKQEYEDVSYIYEVLPHINITIVLWGEDEEVPANANVLFNATTSEYLPTEDYAFISGFLFSKLKSFNKLIIIIISRNTEEFCRIIKFSHFIMHYRS